MWQANGRQDHGATDDSWAMHSSLGRVAFTDFFDHLTAAGVDVRVELAASRHFIVLVDHTAARAIRYPVTQGFDRAATAIVMSGALREALLGRAAHGIEPARGDVVVRGRWPELAALWRARQTIPRERSPSPAAHERAAVRRVRARGARASRGDDRRQPRPASPGRELLAHAVAGERPPVCLLVAERTSGRRRQHLGRVLDRRRARQPVPRKRTATSHRTSSAPSSAPFHGSPTADTAASRSTTPWSSRSSRRRPATT
jgi:hypothetical protein